MPKRCVLYDNKICNDCGECNICDIDPLKICDNCGKCLEGYDYSGIQIDDLIDDDLSQGELNDDSREDGWKFSGENNADPEPFTIYIDDVEGLDEEIQHMHGHVHHDEHEDRHEHEHHNE